MSYDPPERNLGKPLKWILLDSLIIAGIAFVSALPTDRLPDIYDVYVGVRGFFYALLIQLAVERGIKPHMRRNNTVHASVKKVKSSFLQLVSSLLA